MKCPKAPTIVIARGDVLGDVVVTTALIAPLKKHFPDAKIVYMIRKAFIPLIDDHPDVDGCIEDPLPYVMGKEDTSLFKELLKTLNAQKADIFIGLWENPRYAKLAALAGIKIRIGHASSWINRVLYSHSVKSDFLDYLPHKCDLNARLLGPLGIYNASDYPVDLHVSKKTWISGPYTVMHIDAGSPQRVLFAPDLSQIETRLQRQSSGKIILVGRPHNAEAAAYIIKNSLDPSRVVDLTEGVSLLDLKVLISGCQLFVGSDSGPAHIASGFQKPVIVHYVNRIQNAMHWGPWMTPHYIVSSTHSCIDACRPDVCTKPDCRENISMTEYESAIEACLHPETGDAPERNQRFYWLEKTLNIVCVGSESETIRNALSEQGYHTVQAPTSWTNAELVTLMNTQNTNLIVISGKLSLWTRVRLEVCRRWVANKIHFFPKIRRAGNGFEASRVISEMGVGV